MNFIVGSTTPYHPEKLSPSFQVMYMDPDTLLPVDLDTYYFDIEYANQHNKPQWKLLFSARDYFGLPDLSPASFHNYSSSMYTNETKAMLFRNHRRTGYSDDFKDPCDHQCRLYHHCFSRSNDYDEHQNCNDFDKFDVLPPFTSSDRFALFQSIGNLIDHDWYEKV